MSFDKEFLSLYFPKEKGLFLEKLKGDGGHRSYTRIKSQQKTFMLMDCGPEDPSLKTFIAIQKRLKGLAPKIFQYDLKKGLLLLEDLGSQSLESCFLKSHVNQQKLYQKALQALLKGQSQVPCTSKDPFFDFSFFEKELEQALFDVEKYFKQEFQACPPKNLSKAFKDNLKELTMSFCNKTFYDRDWLFCHRDYHSRNLMWHKNKILMIDFQDAGKGPWFYDLASLLYDCYVFIADKKPYYQFYYQQAPENLKQRLGSVDRVEQLTEQIFLQRAFKACGRFCAFKTEKGKDSHLKYLKNTFKLLQQTAKKHSQTGLVKYLEFLLSFY